MPFDPAGNASLPPSTWASPGTTIRTEQHNPPFRDIEAMLSAVLKRDGRDGMIGNLNMGGFRIENVALGSSPTDVALVGQGVPIGSMMDFAGSSAPSGWLLCGGQAVSRTTYAQLFAVIGTTWGAGDGSTTFNVPDRKGRGSIGRDNMGGTPANRVTTAGSGINGIALGSSGGSQTHALTSNENGPHTHTGTTAAAGAHTHTIGMRASDGTGNNDFTRVSSGTTDRATSVFNNMNSAGEHSHGFTTDASGTGAAHNNMPPSLVVNVIIRATY